MRAELRSVCRRRAGDGISEAGDGISEGGWEPVALPISSSTAMK